jgi:hypothetical protein
LYDVEGLALDDQGNLYVADNGFENIRKINLATGIISTIAGVHPASPFTTGYTGDGGPATAATFHSPEGLAYDGHGHLTVLDSGNNLTIDLGNDVVRQIDLATGIITTIAGNHIAGFGGDGGSPAAAMFFYPMAATYDRGGNLYIADSKNNRLRRILLHPTALSSILNYKQASGESVAFTVIYSGLSFGFAPTGTVTFLNGSASLGTGTIAAATDGSGNYVATLDTASLPADSSTITAQYSGDIHYPAEATMITFQQPVPSYTIFATPASLTVKQGASGSVTFTVTPQNGFNQAVSFSCDNTTLPKGVKCSFSPASVAPNGTAAMTTTLTVATTGTAVGVMDTRGTGWLPRGGAALALVLLVIPRVRRKTWLSGTALVIFAACLSGVLGCGGGGSNSGGVGVQNANATPPGSYSIQVTTSAGATSGVTPLTVSLTVTQ